MATKQEIDEQANFDKQISKEIVVAWISRLKEPETLFSSQGLEELKFPALWKTVFKAVSDSGQ